MSFAEPSEQPSSRLTRSSSSLESSAQSCTASITTCVLSAAQARSVQCSPQALSGKLLLSSSSPSSSQKHRYAGSKCGRSCVLVGFRHLRLQFQLKHRTRKHVRASARSHFPQTHVRTRKRERARKRTRPLPPPLFLLCRLCLCRPCLCPPLLWVAKSTLHGVRVFPNTIHLHTGQACK
jgi:hypothetical protein